MTSIIYLLLLLCVAHHVLASNNGSVLGKRKTPTEPESTLSVEDDEVLRLMSTSENEGRVSDGDIASHPKAREFMEAVNENNLVRAFSVFQSATSDFGVQPYCDRQLVSLGKDKLLDLLKIAKTVDDEKAIAADDDASLQFWVSRTIFKDADQELINAVFDEFRLSDRVLKGIAAVLELAYEPDKFINILRRITPTNLESLWWAIDYGIDIMHGDDASEDISSLISALRREPVVGPMWANIAIRCVFEGALDCPLESGLSIREYFDADFIGARSYARALFASSFHSKSSGILQFRWLLERATLQDLIEVLKDPRFGKMPISFRKSIAFALVNVGDESRAQKDRRIRDKMTKHVSSGPKSILPLDSINKVLEYRPNK